MTVDAIKRLYETLSVQFIRRERRRTRCAVRETKEGPGNVKTLVFTAALISQARPASTYQVQESLTGGA